MDNESSINDIIVILRRRFWIFLIIALVIFIPSAIITFILPSVYEAETTIMYKQPTESSVMGNLFVLSQSTTIPNLIEEIKSRSLSEEVASELPRSIINELHIPLKNHDDEKEIIGEYIKKNISVVSVRGTDIVKIKFQAPDPKVAAYIANKIVYVLEKRDIEAKRGEITGVKDFIQRQLNIFANKLHSTEEGLKRFKEKYGEFTIDSLGNVGGGILRSATDAEAAYMEAKTNREAAENRLSYIEKEIEKLNKDIGKNSSSLSQSEELSTIKNNLTALQFQYQTLLLKGYDKSNPEVVRLEQEIKKVRAKYRDALLQATEKMNVIDPYSKLQTLITKSIETQADIATYKAKEEALKKIIEGYNKKLRKLPDRELEFARLLRMKDVNEKIYKMLLEKNEEVRISEAGKVASIRVIDPAVPPQHPIKPKKKVNLAVALVLSIIMGLGGVFIAESMDTTLKTVEDVEKILGIPVLASVPTIKIRDKKGEAAEIEERLIINFKPRSATSEAYRTLRTNIKFTVVDGSLKTLVVSSSSPREGKTLTASNLAITEAQAGLKTLLIDGDLRKPMLHTLFGLEEKYGLSDLLIGNTQLKDIVIKTAVDNLFIIPAGTIPPNPAELLGSKRMEEVLLKLKKEFDIVIMDSPPIFAVSDPIVLGGLSDGLLFVIMSAHTTREIATRCLQTLRYAKINVLGAVLNNVNLKNVYGSYNYYYHNYYSYYTEEK